MSTNSQLRPPDAFLIGVPKSGTSSLAIYLAQHPQIACSSPKESNFYCSDLGITEHVSESDYLKCFRGGESSELRLDGSILSMFSREAAGNIWNANKQAKLVAILRNPIEVMQAWHGQMLFACNETQVDFVRALDLEDVRRKDNLDVKSRSKLRCPQLLYYREMVNYSAQLRRVLSRFPREQLLILFCDDLVNRPQKMYREVVRFLGVDAQFEPEFEKTNESKRRRYPRIHAMLKGALGPLSRRLFQPQLRQRVIRWIDRRNSVPMVRAPLDRELGLRLESEFRPMIDDVSGLLGMDCSRLLDSSVQESRGEIRAPDL